ncbi:MAG: taurine dioxygenase [Alphaproteobacteria bacterium]|nr:taurine dioxygenase [Alphaproteobacteria bacterium]
MTYQHITVKPLAGAIGAEIFDVDLSQPLAPTVLDEIHRAHLEYLVIVFRDQDLTPDSQKAFARNFGSAHINDFFPTVEGHPDVQLVAKNPEDTRNVGDVWHTDVSYVRKPPLGSMLYALEVPEAGGDTMFASTYAAYETLSDGMKELLEGLNAVHSATQSFGVNATGPEMKAKNKSMAFKYTQDAEQDAVHPVVRIHPESGRKSLYVNRSFTKHFEGMTVEESKPLLHYLYDHMARPEFTCRVRWSKGTLTFWDNRCAHHNALNDYQGQRRIMHRVTVLDDLRESHADAAD